MAFGATDVYAADRARCAQTVEPLAQELGVPINPEPDLTEEAYAADPKPARDRVLRDRRSRWHTGHLHAGQGDSVSAGVVARRRWTVSRTRAATARAARGWCRWWTTDRGRRLHRHPAGHQVVANSRSRHTNTPRAVEPAAYPVLSLSGGPSWPEPSWPEPSWPAAFLAGAFLATAFLAGAFLAGAFLAGAFFTGAFLAGAFLTASLLGRSLLGRRLLGRSLLGGSLLGRSRLLGRSGLLGDSLLDDRLANGLLHGRLADDLLDGGLLGRATDGAALDGRSLSRELLCASDNRLELRAGAEGGNRGRLHFDRLAGARVARNAGGATALLEDTETGDGDTVALVHRAHNGVDNLSTAQSPADDPTFSFAVRASISSALFIQILRNSGPLWTDCRHGKPFTCRFPSATPQFQVSAQEDFSNPLAALGR